jgi:hypothetical protein
LRKRYPWLDEKEFTRSGGYAQMKNPEPLQFVGPKDLRTLLERPHGVTVSIYHPTKRVAVEPEENSLHLKNLLGRARELLTDSGMRGPDASKLLNPAAGLLSDNNFWLHQLEGLAIFLDEQGMTFFRLPEEGPEGVWVLDAPLIKPLLSSVFPEARFYLLALSQNELRLLHCSRDHAEEIDLSRYDIPRSLDESLKYDDLDESELQHHLTTGPGRGPIGEHTGSEDRKHGFHGHGESGEGHKTQVRGHFLNVTRGLDKVLGDEGIPLVLSGVEWIQAMYRDVSSYRPILEEHIEGNPDGLSIEKLHRNAIGIIEKHRLREIDSWKDDFGAYLARGTGTTDLEEILRAAYEGRIARLFILRGAETWGKYDLSNQTVEVQHEPQFGDHDLFDLAAQQTILTDGQALLLEKEHMPTDAPAAAMFRW